MSIARYQTGGTLGANPFVVEGPIVLGSGVPAPNFRLGSICWGDAEGEFIYCSLTLGSTTTLQPGQWMQWDKDYAASLLTTANAVVGRSCGVFPGALQPSTLTGGPYGAVTLAAGTYYVWVQRAGQAPSLTTAPTANLIVAETTATAGQTACPASPTVSTKQITPVSYAAANFTFTATATSGSPILTNISGADPAKGPFIGATLSQTTGITGSQTITGITYAPNGNIQSITMSANANGTNTATVTATGVLEVSLKWPYIGKVN